MVVDPDATEPDLDRLRSANEEALWLLARGYPTAAVAAFVGEHRALSASDRRLLECSARASAHGRHHIARELDPEDLARRPLRIDASSVVATVAAGLSGALLLQTEAGLLCDPAWQRSEPLDAEALQAALNRCARTLARLKPAACRWLVEDAWPARDAFLMALANQPSKPRQQAEEVPLVVEALAGAAFVVSADPTVLDRCGTWFNLVGAVLDEQGDCRTLSLA